MKAIIVDLDGTLCNTDHRQHLVKAKKWNEFYDALVDDSPNEWCVELANAIQGTNTHILLVSGRPDSHWQQTTEWLAKHFPNWDGLFMRKEGDCRKDSIVKREIFEQNIKGKFDVLFCVDDRQQVVDVWRELGLVCLQCAKGDF